MWLGGLEGEGGVGTICFMYVSCMFRFLVYFSVFSCQNCGIVRIAEDAEDTEDTEGRGNCLNQDLPNQRYECHLGIPRDKKRGICQNWGIVRITEDTEDTEDTEGRGIV